MMTMKEAVQSAPDINIGDLGSILSAGSILSEARIGLQRASDREIVKRATELAGIEQYPYISGDTADGQIWSIRLTPAILERAELSEAEVWSAAERNTFTDDDFRITPMQSILSRLSGICVPDEPGAPAMYVLTNPTGYNGAVQLFNRRRLWQWASEKGYESLIVLPSSRHEVIIIADMKGPIDMDAMTNMVREVNASEVEPADQLADQAFAMSLASLESHNA